MLPTKNPKKASPLDWINVFTGDSVEPSTIKIETFVWGYHFGVSNFRHFSDFERKKRGTLRRILSSEVLRMVKDHPRIGWDETPTCRIIPFSKWLNQPW